MRVSSPRRNARGRLWLIIGGRLEGKLEDKNEGGGEGKEELPSEVDRSYRVCEAQFNFGLPRCSRTHAVQRFGMNFSVESEVVAGIASISLNENGR
jgi:hypothetical protein